MVVVLCLLLVKPLVLILLGLILLLLLVDLLLCRLAWGTPWGLGWGLGRLSLGRWRWGGGSTLKRATLGCVGGDRLAGGGLHSLGRAFYVSAVGVGANRTHYRGHHDNDDYYDNEGADQDPLPGVSDTGLGLDQGAGALIYVALSSVNLQVKVVCYKIKMFVIAYI